MRLNHVIQQHRLYQTGAFREPPSFANRYIVPRSKSNLRGDLGVYIDGDLSSVDGITRRCWYGQASTHSVLSEFLIVIFAFLTAALVLSFVGVC